MALKKLPDDQLLESYNQALKLNLNIEFIEILHKEIERRHLDKKLKKCCSL